MAARVRRLVLLPSCVQRLSLVDGDCHTTRNDHTGHVVSGRLDAHNRQRAALHSVSMSEHRHDCDCSFVDYAADACQPCSGDQVSGVTHMLCAVCMQTLQLGSSGLCNCTLSGAALLDLADHAVLVVPKALGRLHAGLYALPGRSSPLCHRFAAAVLSSIWLDRQSCMLVLCELCPRIPGRVIACTLVLRLMLVSVHLAADFCRRACTGAERQALQSLRSQPYQGHGWQELGFTEQDTCIQAHLRQYHS